MASPNSYDVIVVGSGSAGFSAVESAHALGARVCLVEVEKLGGECPNHACVPSKALLKTAQIYRTIMNAKPFGVVLGSTSFQFSDAIKYRDRVVKVLTGGGKHGERYEMMLKDMNVDVKFGSVSFFHDHVLVVGGENLHGNSIVIATGTVDFVPPIRGLDKIHYISWRNALLPIRQPKSMAIIGGGPVGCEIATFYASFGTRVVLFQQSGRLLTREDEEISRQAQSLLEKLGVEVVLNADISEIVDGRGVYGVKTKNSNTEQVHAVEQIVLAAGKRANTDTLQLDSAGVKTNEKGEIITNNEQRTNVKHIFAAGDVDGGLQFTHTAHYEGSVAGYNSALTALNKRSEKQVVDERVVPRITYLSSEVASVGMTEKEGKEKFKNVLIGICDFSEIGRSLTDNETGGIVKLVVHPKTRKILGGHIVSSRAGEMIHEVAIAMYANLTIDTLANMIHAYPSFSEAIKVAASRV